MLMLSTKITGVMPEGDWDCIAETEDFSLHYFFETDYDSNIDIWVMRTKSLKAAQQHRDFALHLSRFHSERVTAMEIVRALTAGDLGEIDELRQSDRWELVQRTLYRALGYIQRDLGVLPSEDLLATLEADLRVNATDWDIVKNIVGEMDDRVVERVQNFFGSEIVVGDKFENISNSNIVSRSNVQSSLNALATRGEDGIAEALKEIAQFLETSNVGSEAVDTFEDLAQEVSKPDRRPSRLKAFWLRLVDLAPGVATVAGAAATIIALL